MNKEKPKRNIGMYVLFALLGIFVVSAIYGGIASGETGSVDPVFFIGGIVLMMLFFVVWMVFVGGLFDKVIDRLFSGSKKDDQ